MKKENKVVENNNKKIIMLAAGVIVLVLVIIGIVFGVKSCNKGNDEKKLTNNLISIGKTFYEEFYYPQMEKTAEDNKKAGKKPDDVKAYMENLGKTGFKVNLANLSKISKVDKKLVESLSKAKCDEEKTSVRITPKSPYGKTDYDIEAELECGSKK